jgi:hypothetical protein
MTIRHEPALVGQLPHGRGSSPPSDTFSPRCLCSSDTRGASMSEAWKAS